VANIINQGTYHPRRVNQYVKAMQYASDVNYGGRTRISFSQRSGATKVHPAASVATSIMNAQNIAAATPPLDLTAVPAAPEPWGRTLLFTGSANVVAGSAITVRGYDYLNQPMTEVVNTVAGVTAIQGVRAFKALTSITFAANTGTAPVTMSVGWGNKLGLPYRAIAASTETSNGVPVATQGTLVPGPFAQTNNAAGAADPRGTYQPNTAMNGANEITASFDFANDIVEVTTTVPPQYNCGLMGYPHAG